jgi:HlyD family secretion protein
MTRHNRSKTAAGVGAALALGFCLNPSSEACAAGLVDAAAPPVAVIRAVSGCFTATVRATGFLVARDEARLNLEPDLKVVEVLAREGDQVTSGQALVRLSRQTGDASQTGTSGNAGITLKSPVAGLIVKSTAVVGAMASPLRVEPLFQIAVGNEIELEVEVPSIHITEINPGQSARIEMEGGRNLIGRVRLASAEVNPQTQLGRVRLSLESDPSLRIGMFGRAAINANRSCGVSVPTAAILYSAGGTRVQVVRDSIIQSLSVQVGLHSETESEIVDGLREGDIVVANAGASLREGDKISAIFANGSQPSAR